MTGRLRRGIVSVLKYTLRAFAEGSGARIHAMPHQHPVPDDAPEPAPVPAWHPERLVPLSDLPPAERRWWRDLEKQLR